MALPSKKVVARGLKRKTHTLQTKYDAILEVEKGEKTKTQVAADLGIPLNTLSTWIGKADEYKKAYQNQTFGPATKRMKKGAYPDLDDALDLFMRNARSQPKPISISGPILQGEALNIAKELGHDAFKGSQGQQAQCQGTQTGCGSSTI